MLSPAFVRINPQLVIGRERINESIPWPQLAMVYNTHWQSFEILDLKTGPVDGDFQLGPEGIEGSAGLIGASFFRDTQLIIDMQSQALWIQSGERHEPLDALMKRFPVGAPRDIAGLTSLHHAAIRLRADGVASLLNQKADCNSVDYYGISPLMIAAGRGDRESAEILIKSGAKLDLRSSIDEFTALILAARYGRTELAAVLLDAKDDINLASKTGRTPLFVAADANHLEVAKLLIDRGAKVDKALSTGETPLMAAARNGNAAIVSLLLDNGADPNKVVASGSPLIYALQGASAECVKLLHSRECSGE